LHTLRGSSSKNPLEVAPFAHNLCMPPAQREACRTVINLDIRAVTPLGRSGIRHQQHRAGRHKKQGHDCPETVQTSCPVEQLRHFLPAFIAHNPVLPLPATTPQPRWRLSASVIGIFVPCIVRRIEHTGIPFPTVSYGHARDVPWNGNVTDLKVSCTGMKIIWVDLPRKYELLLHNR
jgi:hypothetical protein